MNKEKALELLEKMATAATIIEETQGLNGGLILSERLEDEGINEETLTKAAEAAYKLIDEDEDALNEYMFEKYLEAAVSAVKELVELSKESAE